MFRTHNNKLYSFLVANHSSVGKESVCSAEDPGLIPGSGRSPGEGNGHPVQNSCLGNSMDRGGWQATVQGVTKSWTQLTTRMHTHMPTNILKLSSL